MDFSLAALAMVAVVALARGQSNCNISPPVDQWMNQGVDAEVSCRSPVTSPKWWIGSDPCLPSTVTELPDCSGSLCRVTSQKYSTMSSCVVCCGESSEESFNPNIDHMCSRIRVCPAVVVSAPSVATTGSTVDIVTFIKTKPRPDPNSVSMTAYLGGQFHMLPESDIPVVYAAPNSNNNYTFIHRLQLPQTAHGDNGSVRIFVNVSSVPRGDSCQFTDSIFRRIQLLHVNSSTTTSPPEDITGDITTETTIKPSGLTEESSELEIRSLIIGVGIGIGAMIILILLIVIVYVMMHYKCLPSRKKSHSVTTSNGSHPLLTVNGTPATTPSSETHRTLGHQNSDTPVSTPTESHVLLNQQLQDSTNMGPHYQEILRHYQSPPATLVGSGAAMPPRDLYIPRPPMKLSETVQLSDGQQQDQLQQYSTQGEALNLHQKYNRGEELI